MEFIQFLSTLSEGYSIRFKQLGVIYNFSQTERQIKTFRGDMTLYTMGSTVINDILDPSSSLDTKHLEDLDKGFIEFFEPYRTVTREAPAPVVEDEPKVIEDEPAQDNQPEEVQPVVDDVPAVEPEPVVVEDEPKEDEPAVEPEPYKYHVQTEQKNPVLEDNPEKPKEEGGYNNEGLTATQIHRIEDQNGYEEPECDTIIGRTDMSPQYGIIGKAVMTKRMIGMDLTECNTISLFGVQGAGKS